ncbi:actin depolymerization factor/cofilin-like domain-containing protein [Streptomyces enissocaesilis]|uniref:ADF-H domain-containing protein n=1 Tax=Streptomyces enissocaesilis TaxID=332589 RepID=A0ABP6JYL0_9ACTN
MATVNDACRKAYEELKVSQKHKYVIFTMSDDWQEIVVEKVSGAPDYDTFLADLPETACRWAVYGFEYEKEGAGARSKIVFYAWMPDGAPIKQKMAFADAKDTLRRTLPGIGIDIQGTDYNEITFESVLGKANRGA